MVFASKTGANGAVSSMSLILIVFRSVFEVPEASVITIPIL